MKIILLVAILFVSRAAANENQLVPEAAAIDGGGMPVGNFTGTPVGNDRQKCKYKNPCILSVTASYKNWDYVVVNTTTARKCFAALIRRGSHYPVVRPRIMLMPSLLYFPPAEQ